MANRLQKFIKGLMTKSTTGTTQYKRNQKARAKYLTNPTKVFNPKKSKYY